MWSAIAVALTLPVAVWAQGTPPAQQSKQVPLVPTIVANSDLVNMTFSVQDKHGSFVPDLKESDFQVTEDGKPQEIRFFSVEDQLPLTLGLLLDTSPSQTNVLGQEQQVSDQFFRQVITPKDLAFVIGFDVDATLLQDLTSSQALLSASVDHAHIGGADGASYSANPGPFPTKSRGGATHLWDSIYLACHDELAHQVGRKAIIVVTDGGEQGSTYTNQDALRAALDSNTIVYAVIAADRSFYGGMSYGAGAGPGQLAKIAEETGGRSINAGRNIAQAFDRIQQELRSQYTLAYRSTNTDRNGKFRAVKITLANATAKANDGAKVHARTGYFAPQG
ncbi:MAG TPA: VWA domain-containing protein [Terriglobales bacterium]